MPHAALFNPFILSNLTLKNRIVMAPMTRSHSPQHIPTQEVADYYTRRAIGGVGLIITEATSIQHPGSHAYPNVPNIFGDAALEGWRQVIKQVHAAGSKIFLQIWHVGSVRQQHATYHKSPDSSAYCCYCNSNAIPGYGPSAVAHPYVKNGEIPQVLREQDITEIIQAFADAAANAKAIGFDGIELHGAHGYLIDQFFWDATNQRTDQYGGKTLAERTRFAVEVISAVRRAVGANYPISFRFSQWKLGGYTVKMANNPKELEDFLAPLSTAGVDIFHCSTRRFFEAEFADSSLNLAGWTRKLTGKPTITVGSVGLNNDFMSTFAGQKAQLSEKNWDKLLESLTLKEFDLVAIGRMLLANPDLANRLEKNELNDMVPFSNEEHVMKYI